MRWGKFIFALVAAGTAGYFVGEGTAASFEAPYNHFVGLPLALFVGSAAGKWAFAR